MKHGVGIGLGLLLVACSLSPNDTARGKTQVEATSFSPTSPRPLSFTVETTPLANGVHIEGQTNLPDGTELMVSFQRGPVMGGEKVSVSNGRFSEDVLPRGGKSIPPGNYNLEISTPLGDLQPAYVKAQLGSDYEALTGPLLGKGVIGERGIDYTSGVHIGGAIDPKADLGARREALQQVKEADERDCPARPDVIEKYTGVPMSAEARERTIRECFAQSARLRANFSKEPLPKL